MIRAPHVLIVEDDGRLRESMARALRFCGYSIDTAEDAHDGRRHLGRRQYDVVVTDVAMEGNGFSMLALIQEIDDAIPVVAVSGLDTPGLETILREAGAWAFLQKPFGLAELREAVRHVLARRA